ncbi:MAG: hypothetical protein ACLP05_13550, partial [Candidatus Kryptoniota bacterium]
SLVKDFVNFNSLTRKVDKEFKIGVETQKIYDVLSKWTHSLGSDYLLDLSILGRKKINVSRIGEIKRNFSLTTKYSSIIYLVMRPGILNDLSKENQRYLLQNLSLSERRKLRDLIGS